MKNITATEIDARMAGLRLPVLLEDYMILELARMFREVEARIKAEQKGEMFDD